MVHLNGKYGVEPAGYVSQMWQIARSDGEKTYQVLVAQGATRPSEEGAKWMDTPPVVSTSHRCVRRRLERSGFNHKKAGKGFEA
jgi:hypothetical protein